MTYGDAEIRICATRLAVALDLGPDRLQPTRLCDRREIDRSGASASLTWLPSLAAQDQTLALMNL
jgi:hypothetical protein